MTATATTAPAKTARHENSGDPSMPCCAMMTSVMGICSWPVVVPLCCPNNSSAAAWFPQCSAMGRWNEQAMEQRVSLITLGVSDLARSQGVL